MFEDLADQSQEIIDNYEVIWNNNIILIQDIDITFSL